MCLAYSIFPNKGTRPKEMHVACLQRAARSSAAFE
jgi:hypothetical protein